MPKFGLKMNNLWSNLKLKGQMTMKFYELDITKADETRNLMKLNSSDLDLRSWRNLCFKISKNLHPNLGKTMEILISKLK